MKRILAAPLACCLLWCNSALAGALPDPALARLHPGAESLQWDALMGPPQWVQGEESRLDPETGMYLLDLADARFVVLRLRADEQLRINAATVNSPPPRVTLAEDGSLFRPARLARAGPGAWLLAEPRDSTVLLRLTGTTSSARYGVYLSRVRARSAAVLVPDRQVELDNALSVRIDDDTGNDGHAWFAVPPGREMKAGVRDLQHLYLHLRLPAGTEHESDWILDAWADDRHLGSMAGVVASELFAGVRVNGVLQPVSAAEVLPLTIPPGTRQLRIALSVPGWVSLRGSDEAGYLFPRWNDPWRQRSAVAPIADLPGGPVSKIALLRPAKIPQELRAGQLRRLQQDNLYAGSALRAEALARHWLASPATPEKQRSILRHAVRDATHWKALRPANPAPQVLQRPRYLVRERVRDAELEEMRIVLRTGGANRLHRRLVPLHTYEMTTGMDAALEYRLPIRSADSRLLLAMAGAVPEFRLQFDDQEAIAVHRDPQVSQSIALDQQFIQAALAQNRTDAAKAAWLPGGNVADPVRRVWPAAHAEVHLPQDVRRVRVWIPQQAGAPAAAEIGVALRDGHAYQLNEAGYRYRRDRAGGVQVTASLFRDALQAMLACEDPSRADVCLAPVIAQRSSLKATAHASVLGLVNDWIPLLRMLRARLDLFHSDIGPLGQWQHSGTGRRLDLPAARERAANHLQAGSPMLALEAWHALDGQSAARAAGEDWLGRAVALEALGETYLAERLLRALIRHSPSGVNRDAAMARLAASPSLETPMRTGLLLARFRTDPNALDHDLLAALLAEGQDDFALRAALALGLRPDAGNEVLLAAAWREQWWVSVAEWQVVDSSYAAYAAFGAQGAYATRPQALAGFFGAAAADQRTTDERPVTAEDRVRQAGQLARQMKHATGNERAALVRDWLHWWASLPGSRQLRDDHDQVRSSAGSEWAAIPARDLDVELLRAQPGVPVNYEVYGPTRVVVTLRRPIPAGADVKLGPEPGWVKVRVADQAWSIPLLQGQASRSLDALQDGSRVTAAERFSWQLPAGLHQFVIAPESGEVLISIEAEQPRWNPGLLPRPEVPLVQAVLNGEAALPFLDRDASGEMIIVRADHSLLKNAMTVQSHSARPLPVALLPVEPAAIEVSAHAQRAWTLLRDGQGKIDDTTMTELTRLAIENPADREVQQAWQGLRAGGWGWQKWSVVEQSAGLQEVTAAHWQPANPTLRARSLLLPAMSPDVSVLTGDGELLMEVDLAVASRVRLGLHLQYLPTLPEQVVDVELEIDDRQVAMLQAQAATKTQVVRLLQPGRHILKLRPVRLPVNALLAVTLEQESAVAGKWVSLLEGRDRNYFVATRAEPVVAFLDGPGIYRIDRVEDGELSSEWVFREAGGGQLQLTPSAGQPRAGFTVYRYSASVGGREPRREPLAPLPSTQVARMLMEAVPYSEFVLHDPRLPGGNESGTTSVFARAGVRLQQDEEGATGSGNTRLAEQDYGVQHDYYNPETETYWSTRLFLRNPQNPDRMLGLRARYDYEPRHSIFSHGFGLDLNVQEPTRRDATEYSATLRGHLDFRQQLTPITSQRWTGGAFARYLSLSPRTGGAAEAEPDVYSSFKQDHLHGVSLDWNLHHAPWRDTRLRAGLGAHSNENFNLLAPDRFTGRLGWDQALGDYTATGEYRLRSFQADNDRRLDADRDNLVFTLSRDLWLQRDDRLALELRMDRDLYRNLWTGSLNLQWYFSGNRDYYDFRPGEVDFRGLQELRIPTELNHAIVEAE